MIKMILATRGSNSFAKAFAPVPLVTGSTPANPQRTTREEKSDLQLVRIYLDNWIWFQARSSKKSHCACQILGWKIDQLGGMAAAW